MSRKKTPAKKAPKVVTGEVLDAEYSLKKKAKTAPKRQGSVTKPHREAIEADFELADTDEIESSDHEESEIEPEISSDESRELAVPDPQELDREIDRASRAISATDPLKRYLDELKNYPLLEPEAELKLALELQKSGSVEAARRLVQANLRLVVKIAFEYRSVYANAMDLIQEGNVGLMKAVSKYDPTKGARLGYYASWWIRSYILKYLLDNFRLVRVGTTQAQKKLFFHLMREKERLEAQGVLAAPKLLADKIGVKEKEVVEMEHRLGSAGGEVSLDSPMQSGGDGARGTFTDLLRDEAEGVDEGLAREQLLALLKKRLPEFEKTLKDKEKKILRERLLAEDPKTLQEIGDLYGLTRERARQIEVEVLGKLRDFLKPSLK